MTLNSPRASCKIAINVGSSSIKTSIFHDSKRVDININFIGLERQTVKVKYGNINNHVDRAYQVEGGDDLKKAASVVIGEGVRVLQELNWPTPEVIGHRVKFAGFGRAVERFTEKNEQRLLFNDYLSSRHNALCLEVLRETKTAFESAVQLMVRDQVVEDLTLHDENKIPFDHSTIRRYGLYSHGYHGLAVKACLEHLSKIFGNKSFDGVVCQLGSGVSFTAVKKNKAVFNTMQYAACDGPVMHNRSGTQPAGLVLRFLKYGLSPNSLSNMYTRLSGIYGLAGLPADSNITVEDILSQTDYIQARESYIKANSVELFRAITVIGEVNQFIFSGGLATKHRWLGPELLLCSKVITPEIRNALIAELEKPGIACATAGNTTVYLIDIDEQACILKECENFSNDINDFEITSGACEVPGTSVGVVKEGKHGWRKGFICLCLADTELPICSDDLPEALIFFGGPRSEFFIRSVVARSNGIPAIYIAESSHDPLSLLGSRIYIDTPTHKLVIL